MLFKLVLRAIHAGTPCYSSWYPVLIQLVLRANSAGTLCYWIILCTLYSPPPHHLNSILTLHPKSMHYKRTHDGLCTIPIRDRNGWSSHLLTVLRALPSKVLRAHPSQVLHVHPSPFLCITHPRYSVLIITMYSVLTHPKYSLLTQPGCSPVYGTPPCSYI